MDQILVGKDLEEHIEYVRALAGEVRDIREAASSGMFLRDMSAWTELRRAQAWVAEQEPPRCAWQGERVRRTVLQFGYGRPVMEGRHIGLLRPAMTMNNLTYEVAVFPEGITDHSMAYIAAALIHEATHIVTRELFCERMRCSTEEALVICDLNDKARYDSMFTGEALAFWNQVSWLFVRSHETLESEEAYWMFKDVVQMINRPDAAVMFAQSLDLYTARSLQHAPEADVSLPFIHLYDACAGLPIALGDLLAPSILNPLLHVRHT